MNLHEPTIITKRICNLLDKQQVIYKLISHPECRTSEESAKARAQGGASQVTGAKAILMRISRKIADAEFGVFVLPGDRQLDSKALKKILKQQFADFKSFRFATATEMAQLTGGLIPGTMPPFAQSIFENIYYLYIDEDLLQRESVGFNAGCLTRSIVMSLHDYLKAVSPKTIFAFSQSINLKQQCFTK